MDQTDFLIVIVGGIIIIAILIFISLNIFGKKKEDKLIETVLLDIDKIEPGEFQPEKFGIGIQGIEGLERGFHLAHECQKKDSMKELMGEKKEDKSSIEPEKKAMKKQVRKKSENDQKKPGKEVSTKKKEKATVKKKKLPMQIGTENPESGEL